ncbi:hypothetical protein CPB86DRAFT_795340 [Serendipita vermifera]|nr:hypothetical protein CPB86DRAFT_795340 [Serendipita vermifera]
MQSTHPIDQPSLFRRLFKRLFKKGSGNNPQTSSSSELSSTLYQTTSSVNTSTLYDSPGETSNMANARTQAVPQRNPVDTRRRSGPSPNNAYNPSYANAYAAPTNIFDPGAAVTASSAAWSSGGGVSGGGGASYSSYSAPAAPARDELGLSIRLDLSGVMRIL